MPLPAATSTADPQQDQAAINELLNQEGEAEETSATKTAEEPAEETSTATAEREEPEATEETSEEPADEETESEETAEEPEEESELTLDERDRDYSQGAYEKAAKHYSRTHGVQLNPDDPAHRVLLKEVMDRGRALAEQREREESARQAKPDEGKAADEAKTAQSVQPTPEQIKAALDNVAAVAKARTNPTVANHVANRFVKALWPGEDVKLTQEQANDITAAFHEFFLLAMDDVAPTLQQVVNAGLVQDPVWGTVRSSAIEERAFEHLDKTLGVDRFADMERMVEDGSLKSIMDKNPQLFNGIKAGDGKDPVLNRAAQLEAAYKFARGEKTLDQVTRAVQTGKKQATETAKKIAAGRVAPGTPKGGFRQPASEGQDVINNIVRGEGSGSKFARAVKSELGR